MIIESKYMEIAYTPEIVTKQNKLFSIPIYQRLFTWGEPQIKGLLKDLEDHFLRYKDKSKEPYYIGILTGIESDGKISLIDGQQRMVVLILLGTILKTYCTVWENFSKKERLDFPARHNDNVFLQKLINGSDDNTSENTYVNWIMQDGRLTIKNYVSALEVRLKEQKTSIQAFSEWAYENISFFLSILPASTYRDPDSLNRYFEAMNSTGKNLEEHEILKVEILNKCHDFENDVNKKGLTSIWNFVCEMDKPLFATEVNLEERAKIIRDLSKLTDTNQRYGYCIDLIKRFCATFSNENEGAVRKISEVEAKKLDSKTPIDNSAETRSVIDFPEFLKLVLSLQGEPNKLRYNRGLLDLFVHDEDTSLNGKEIIQFYCNLVFYRLIFDLYIIRISRSGEGNNYSLLYVDNKKFNPSKEESEGISCINCLIQYQSMLYVSETETEHWIEPFIRDIEKNIEEKGIDNIDSAFLLNDLKQIDNQYHKRPDLQEKNSIVESLSYGAVNRYIFWRLDYYLWERRSEFFDKEELGVMENVSRFIFRRNAPSIEHLHPQNETFNESWGVDEINRFGNLALISQSMNSEQSNDYVGVKFARVRRREENKNIESLKLYRMYLDANGNEGNWTKDIMKCHEIKMIKLLDESYQDAASQPSEVK